MNLRQSVADYLINKRNTIIQIAFTTVFAYVFVNIYRPFGYDNWFASEDWKRMVASAIVVIAGMVLIILSRLIFFHVKKSHEVTVALYSWFIIAEIVCMGLFYTCLEIFILHDPHRPIDLMFNAVQNTTLLLLIPYIVSSLFFAWKDIKKKFDNVITQFREPSETFIPFKDEKDQLRITLKLIDILYLESNDNYVNIHYNDNGKQKTYMIRNTLKNFEKELKDYPIYRNHRKYAINIKNVKQFRRGKKGYELIMNSENENILPVSRSYEEQIKKHFSA